ncbi:MAG: TolC family outer membrane protein [Gammaproteobacteria bacterium]|nr:TolC family outer membrane protein [Gammaproteobacteria bacterium]
MKKLKQLWCALFLSLGLTPLLHAADLLDIYLQALDNDPEFKGEFSLYMSETQNIPIARAPLLPQVALNGLTTANTQNVNAGRFFSISEAYKATQFQVSASQALFNYKAWAQVQQAKASVRAAHARFNDRAQDLILRTVEAYFNVLFAYDSLRFGVAKKNANKRQLDQSTQRFNVGLDAITSVYDAQAAYDQSVAQVIEAKNNVMIQSEELRKITNHTYGRLAPLRNQALPLMRPEPDNIETWVATGLKQNYKLFAAKYRLEAAREKIKAQAAGNWPIIKAQFTDVRRRNEGHSADFANFFVPKSQRISTAGVVVDFPIVQGGLILAETRQAQFDYQAASQELEEVYRRVVTDSRTSFGTINNGISKVKADRKSVFTQGESVESTEAGFFVGTRNMVDVVNAQENLFQAQTNLASDQYTLIGVIIKLKYLAGTLNVNDLEEINSWLVTERIDSRPPQLSESHE